MFASLETARQEATGVRVYLLTAYYLFSRHLWILALLYGIGLLALGALVVQPIHPVFSGMLGVWGVTMVGLGVLGALFFAGKMAYARLNTA